MLLLATAAVLVFYINTPLLYCYPVLERDYLMRISERKCFSRHGAPRGLWANGTVAAAAEGTGESGGALLCSCRGAGRAGLGHPHPPAQLGGTEGCPAWSSRPQLQKHGDFQAGNKRGISTLQSKRELGSAASESGVRGRKNAFETEFSYISSLLEMAWIEGQAVLFRPAFLQSRPLITAAAMQTRCCYGCICLFHSCVPALNPAVAFRAAVTAQR